MERKLHLLESFMAEAADGTRYKVCGYEHMVRDESLPGADDHWEPTGVAEYRTVEGAAVTLNPDGTMQLAQSGVALVRETSHASA